MTKTQFIDQVARSAEADMSKKDIEALLEAMFTVMGQAVRNEGRFSYPGFGVFKLQERGARTGRNPQTGAPVKIKASRTVAFRPAPALKESL